MKILALSFLISLCFAWSAYAEAPPPDLRLGHDEVRIDLSDPVGLRTILNQLALNEGWEGPWWRALTKAEAASAASRCSPDKRPVAIIGVTAFCALGAEALKTNPAFTRHVCAIFDRYYAGFPDPVKPFMLVCRKPTL